MITRRHVLKTGAALGVTTVLPFQTRAAGHGGDMFETANGQIGIHPLEHASFVITAPTQTICVDPVAATLKYMPFPQPDLILVTHEHGDHYQQAIIDGISTDDTRLVTNPAVHAMLPGDVQTRATAVANGEQTTFQDIAIDAIPAYNTTPERMNFHPQGRDNGYVLTIDGFRIYISGDTEDIPEMRALQDIDLAFVCMNLPFTMDASAAADAVRAFAPTYVYPYHYRGRDNGTQDPAEFAEMVGDAAQVKMGGWY
ncbi:MBL fold metallo-hydrolase [Octadecabacter sp. R77987]|uniref:MBL fold metallo-hydrolase n=1 Tax=Octadecabacter sp. R77987 TaxID=3093874 RepID=UPI00366F8D41